METIKIMPCLDMKEGRVVKGIHFLDKPLALKYHGLSPKEVIFPNP